MRLSGCRQSDMGIVLVVVGVVLLLLVGWVVAILVKWSKVKWDDAVEDV